MNQTAPISRSISFGLFLTGSLWVLAARSLADHAATGFSARFHLEIYAAFLAAAFLLFLVFTGFAAINWVATRSANLREVNALPARATSAREWGIGAALGWALIVVAILPMALAGDLHPNFWFQPRGFGLALLSLLTLLILTLAQEAVFRGFLFARLVRAIGPTLATILMSLIYTAVFAFHPES
ncbi:MAG: CPBP family intramembrane glutamate endopeptidase, partial [Acidobacteriaceae bacterium]